MRPQVCTPRINGVTTHTHNERNSEHEMPNSPKPLLKEQSRAIYISGDPLFPGTVPISEMRVRFRSHFGSVAWNGRQVGTGSVRTNHTTRTRGHDPKVLLLIVLLLIVVPEEKLATIVRRRIVTNLAAQEGLAVATANTFVACQVA